MTTSGAPTQQRIVLVVETGPDAGNRLLVGESAKVVGRSRTADLVLSDGGASRRHIEVVRRDGALHVSLCTGAAPVLVNGRARERAVLRGGERILLGDTVLRVDIGDPPAAPETSADTSNVKTILSGTALDVRGLAAVFALVEALDAVGDASAIEACVLPWAEAYAGASAVSHALEVASGGTAAVAGKDNVHVERTKEGERLTVPAHTSEPGWLTFSLKDGAPVDDATRRLLVVAGRIVASRVAQLRLQRVVEDERASLRQLAMGSAREFLGSSKAAAQVAAVIPRLAAADAMVLLTGESGTGKSFVARLIHESGRRASAPLRVLNCAAIPEGLLESELFGHERGAFTGAVVARAGAFESAGDGTLFLDEVGELSLANQAKLLRALEERRFERVGSNRAIELRARVLTATNRDLEAMVADGRFRGDLFFRISVIKLRVPSLRERREDIAMLARSIVTDLLPSAGRRVDGLTPETLRVLTQHTWGGNVRELRNALEHAVVMGDDPWIRPSDLPDHIAEIAAKSESAEEDPFVLHLPRELAWVEERAVAAALLSTQGNRTRAAAVLGVPRSTLYNKLAAMPGLARPSVPPPPDEE